MAKSPTILAFYLVSRLIKMSVLMLLCAGNIDELGTGDGILFRSDSLGDQTILTLSCLFPLPAYHPCLLPSFYFLGTICGLGGSHVYHHIMHICLTCRCKRRPSDVLDHLPAFRSRFQSDALLHIILS